MKRLVNDFWSVLALCTLLALLIFGMSLKAQGPPVVLMTAPASSTITNCGTPTVPSICVVSTGVFVWQTSAQGWFLVAPAASAGVASVTVCNAAGASCGTAQTGAVTLDIPKTVTVTSTATAPTVTSTGSLQ